MKSEIHNVKNPLPSLRSKMEHHLKINNLGLDRQKREEVAEVLKNFIDIEIEKAIRNMPINHPEDEIS